MPPPAYTKSNPATLRCTAQRQARPRARPPPADANADVVLRRDAEGASQRHLRSPLRQTHGDLRRPVPVERDLVVPPPVVRFLTIGLLRFTFLSLRQWHTMGTSIMTGEPQLRDRTKMPQSPRTNKRCLSQPPWTSRLRMLKWG